jgi:hypothetical protein
MLLSHFVVTTIYKTCKFGIKLVCESLKLPYNLLEIRNDTDL